MSASDGVTRPSARARDLTLDVTALVALKAVLGAWILHLGFTHVSDDDYARVVIAQLWVHAPKLDPSGTSWLPFPFWMNGVVMMVLGRSLETARAIAFVVGAVSVAPVYLAARAVGAKRWVALVGVAIAMATPWNAWLAVATVPEGFTGALVASGAMVMGARGEESGRARLWGAVALLVAALSRYEAWPVCGVFAMWCGVSAVLSAGAGRIARGAGASRMAHGAGASRIAHGAGASRIALALGAAIAMAGPLAWMAWNAYAHGSAFHFVARVTAYRQAIGAADVALAEKVLGYPRALVASSWELVALGALGAIGFAVDRDVRRRWTPAVVAMVIMMAALVYGDVRDGAPTHHAARALTPLFWVLAMVGVDGARAVGARVAWARPKREMFVVGVAGACAVAWMATLGAAWREYPARALEEQRGAQVARGRELRERGARGIEVAPCAYEHFALMAGYGAPEGVAILSAGSVVRGDAARSALAECPGVQSE